VSAPERRPTRPGPSHPRLAATLLMVGIVVLLVLVSLLSV
jgi:hypothetical protein